ncbi:alpha-2C adrenergic receptor-like isoform X1 [Schistocerca gregaria]|uniref:alpha-2C adrenergic receptor-like isoform X1 n=1 Tax=Schistocerca gregaria TaxID=7010 RepID=UPI00211E0B2D|nr:alpha-2C adrenergic receptor-like isoform X1 [Schistocerca gregaria]
MNFFIMQLALADLTVGLINVLTDIVTRITIVWYAGNVACKIVRFLQAVVTYSSTYMLVALSIDRYDAITHPMNFSGSWRRARALVVTAWGLSFLFSIPSMIFFEEQPIQGHAQCWIDFPHNWQWQVYMTLVAVALFIVPTVIISACYAVIVFTIWSKSKLLAPSVRPSRWQQPCGQRRQQGSGAELLGRPGLPARQLAGTHTPGQDQDRQDDVRHRLRVRAVLEPVLRVRPAAGVRPRAEDADDGGAGDIHTESGAAQQRSQPGHLLRLLHADMPHPQEAAAAALALGVLPTAGRPRWTAHPLRHHLHRHRDAHPAVVATPHLRLRRLPPARRHRLRQASARLWPPLLQLRQQRRERYQCCHVGRLTQLAAVSRSAPLRNYHHRSLPAIRRRFRGQHHSQDASAFHFRQQCSRRRCYDVSRLTTITVELVSSVFWPSVFREPQCNVFMLLVCVTLSPLVTSHQPCQQRPTRMCLL